MKVPCVISIAAVLFASVLATICASAFAASPDPNHVFVQTYCIDCHDAETREGHLDLSSVKLGTLDSDSFAAWMKVLDRVVAKEMPPSEAIQPQAAEREAFGGELTRSLRSFSQAQQTRDGRARARRLNRDEYQNTLRDLLGVHRDYRAMLPEDGRALGFDKVASALSVSAEHLEAYMAAAEAALNDAFAPDPEPTKREVAQRWEDMSRLQRIFRYRFAQTPDALVHFGDHWDNITGFEARQPGRYRFTLRGRAFQSKEPVKARVRAGMDAEASRRIVTYTEFPPEGAEFVVETWLNPRETLHVCPIGTTPPARNLTIHRVNLTRENPGSRYKGPGLALEWVEVEGPLPDHRFHTTMLAGVDLSNGTRADAEKVLSRFLPLAFRRPVTPHEVEHFLELFDNEIGERGFVAGLKGALQAVLCSPHFLYLHGQPGLLDDHALAARLSYFLWNSMPDDTLRQLAGDEKLCQPDALHQQVERMLNDPRAEAFKESFTGQWLDLRLINATTPDLELYPEFDELLEWSCVRETRLFFAELLQRDLSLLNLVQSDFLMLNDRLALHYGIPGVSGLDFRSVPNLPGSVRGGLLGQASILKVTANGTTTSPILRGAWVMDRLVGQPPPPPPANVPALEPDIRGAITIREQLTKHRDEATCAACHAKIDPPGFALESFDVIGGWRERYRASRDGATETMRVERPLFLDIRALARDPERRVHPQATVGLGPVVDASSEFEGRAFRDVIEFRQMLLADEDRIARAFVAQLTTHSSGLSSTRNGVQVPPEKDPAAIFRKLFIQGTPGEVREQEHRLRHGRSILDSVRSELAALEGSLPLPDRDRLDQYTSAVRDVEKRLHNAEVWMRKPRPAVAAEPPTAYPPTEDIVGRSAMMYDLMHLALQTDSTRLITMLMDQAGGNGVPPIEGVSEGRHGLSHHGMDPAKIAQLRRIELAEMKAFATFLEKLQSTQQVAGGSLLDHTMVLYGSNMGNASSHDTRNLPILLAGGGFKHGQHLAFDQQRNVPLSNLFASMLQRFGVETDKFGTGTGTLTGLEFV